MPPVAVRPCAPQPLASKGSPPSPVCPGPTEWQGVRNLVQLREVGGGGFTFPTAQWSNF